MTNLYSVDLIVYEMKKKIKDLAEAAPPVLKMGDEYLCPYCLRASDWLEYDIEVRQNVGEGWVGDFGGSGIDFTLSEPDFDHLLYACGRCSALVTIPLEVKVTHG